MDNSFRLAVAAAALGMLGGAHARPVVIENVSSFSSPNPAYASDGAQTRFADQVGIDGDYAIATGTRRVDDPDFGPFNVRTAFLFQRNGTGWTLVRQLPE